MDMATPVVFVVSYKKSINLRKITLSITNCHTTRSTKFNKANQFYSILFYENKIKNIVIFNMSSFASS